MRRFLSRLRSFFQREDGPTSVEYAVLLALIIAVTVAAVQNLGRSTRRDFRVTARVLRTANGS